MKHQNGEPHQVCIPDPSKWTRENEMGTVSMRCSEGIIRRQVVLVCAWQKVLDS